MKNIIKLPWLYKLGDVIEKQGRKKNKQRLIRLGMILKGNS